MKDLDRREWAILVPVVAVAILMGVLPAPFLRAIEPSVDRVVERVVNRQPALVKQGAEPGPLEKVRLRVD